MEDDEDRAHDGDSEPGRRINVHPAEFTRADAAARAEAGGADPILLTSKIGPMTSTTTYRMWQRLSTRPGGSRLFSAAAMARVPYFASVLPHVRCMEPGLAEVDVPKWLFVKVQLTARLTYNRHRPEANPSRDHLAEVLLL
jgi:Domain of unknown function (DUF4442)